MAWKRSAVDELAAMRARGQRPDMPIMVGVSSESAAWAQRNGFFYVRAKECGDDLTAFAGLFVLIRERSVGSLFELAARLALTARMVTLFPLDIGEAEHLVA